jgi:signal transduction histidine kinase
MLRKLINREIKNKEFKLPKYLNAYRQMDFLTQMKAQFIFRIYIAFSTFLLFLIISTFYLELVHFHKLEPFVLSLEIICWLLSIYSFILIKNTKLNMAIHFLLIVSFAFIWMTIIYEADLNITGFDSIAFTFGVLSMIPLISDNKQRNIVFYTLINLFALCAFALFIVDTNKVLMGDLVDYVIDNSITYIFMGIISYNIHIIYKKSIDRSEEALAKAKIAEKEVKVLNEELEEKVRLRTNELNQAVKLIENSNLELQELNENMAIESHKLLELNDKLCDSENELKAANDTKDKFFSIIAHDLRNPFVALLNNSELLLRYYDRIDEAKRLSMISGMKEASQTTYYLLENLLQWSLSQRGLIQFITEKFDFYAIVKNNIELFGLMADKKKIRLKNSVKERFIVCADKNLINTVIRNLISNAVKFTSENGIIEVNAISQDNEIIVSVSDTGTGMNPEIIINIFDSKINETKSGTSGEQGTGLGLSLCKEFIEIHNGKIWVESEIGVGSTFYFCLPNI